MKLDINALAILRQTEDEKEAERLRSLEEMRERNRQANQQSRHQWGKAELPGQ